jgi:hypothetical protein
MLKKVTISYVTGYEKTRINKKQRQTMRETFVEHILQAAKATREKKKKYRGKMRALVLRWKPQPPSFPVIIIIEMEILSSIGCRSSRTINLEGFSTTFYL